MKSSKTVSEVKQTLDQGAKRSLGFFRKNCTPTVEDIDSLKLTPWISSKIFAVAPLEFQQLLLYPLEFSIDIIISHLYNEIFIMKTSSYQQ